MGYSGINVTRGRGGGGVRRIFFGSKIFNSCIFWVEDLTVYFFGSEKSARIFVRQANSSYAIQAKVPARSEGMIRIISSLVFFWVHNIRSMYFFGCKILGSVEPSRHVYTRVPHAAACRFSFTRCRIRNFKYKYNKNISRAILIVHTLERSLFKAYFVQILKGKGSSE